MEQTSLKEDEHAARLKDPRHVCHERVDAVCFAAQLVEGIERDHCINAGVGLGSRSLVFRDTPHAAGICGPTTTQVTEWVEIMAIPAATTQPHRHN